MPKYFKVVDCNDELIEVGTPVNTGDDLPPGEVISISDPDGDIDGETGRQIGISPRIVVQWPADGNEPAGEETFHTHWTAQGSWDDDAPYRCDDLEVEK